jgi:hypothetical protein
MPRPTGRAARVSLWTRCPLSVVAVVVDVVVAAVLRGPERRSAVNSVSRR